MIEKISVGEEQDQGQNTYIEREKEWVSEWVILAIEVFSKIYRQYIEYSYR